MKIKIAKLKSTLPQKVGKVLLWTLVGFLLLRGMGSIFKEDDSVKAQNMIDNFIKTFEWKSDLEQQGKAFAEGFALEYLSMEGHSREEYKTRLSKYLQTGVDINTKLNTDTKTEAFSAAAYKITWLDETSMNADVKVRVKYFNITDQAPDAMKQSNLDSNYKIEDVCLRIPLKEKEGSFVVCGYPAFIPAADKADMAVEVYSGNEVSNEVKKTISGVIESFFKIYYSGSSGEISYYMLDSANALKGLEGRYEFVNLEEISVYQSQGNTGFYVIAKLSVKDSLNGAVVEQMYRLELVRKEERYYISKMNI